jgi:hypothetical protein
VLGPVLWRYHRVAETHGFSRTRAESAGYSADVLSYVSVWHQSRMRPFLRDERTVVRALFPGVVVAALAIAAFAWRRPTVGLRGLWTWGAPAAGALLIGIASTRAGPSLYGTAGLALLLARAGLPLPSTTPGLYGRVACLAALLSLGPVPAVAGTAIAASGPHAWLIDLLPGASGLRMPARHGLMVSFALAVLAGYGAQRVLAWRPLLARGGAAVAGLVALLVLDGYAGPLPVAPFDAHGSAEDRRVHAWIAGRGPGPVMHLPIADADIGRAEIANASVQLTYHYATLLHGQRTVTGGTDFLPRFAAWLHGPGSPFGAPMDGEAALDLLRRVGVRYVLLHRDEFRGAAEADAYEASLLRAGRHVRHSHRVGTVVAFELHDPLPRPAAATAPPERGPPQRVLCRYVDAGVPDPSPAAGAGVIGATWACDVAGGPIAAARWTFDWNRPETWPTRLRVDASGGSLLDLDVTARLADAMVTRPANSPQLTVPLRATGSTLLVRTWGAREPRSTPPFWLEVWMATR